MSRLNVLAARFAAPGRPVSIAGPPAPGSGAGQPRILVCGNCQARAIASAAALLVPDASVDYLPPSRLGALGRDPSAAAATFRRYDAVLAARFAVPQGWDALRAETGLHEIPVVVFPAFHPDLVYVTDRADPGGRGLAESAVGDYHSALVLFAWAEGLTAAAAERLLSAGTFRALGYLDLWDGASAALLAIGRAAGLDLEAHLLRWSRRGAFMHSSNHPKMFVAADLARDLLGRAGIPFGDIDLDAALPDEIVRQGSWPVYPPIAEHYGVPGSTLFLTQAGRRRPFRSLGIRAFVEGSYAAYARHRPADLGCARVEGWRRNRDTWRMLRERAAG